MNPCCRALTWGLAALSAPLLTTTPARADGLAPRAGEIQVSGTVQSFLPKRAGLVLAVNAVCRPDGTVALLDAPRPKTVRGPVPTGLKVGDMAAAVGPDAGPGQTLRARRIGTPPAPTPPANPMALPPLAPSPPVIGLPDPWQDADIGKVGARGAASVAQGVWTVTGAGEDIFGQADSFHFVYQPLHGDGVITARVVSYQRRDMWTKVGVMARASVDAGAPFADVLVTPDKGAEFQRRIAANGDTQTSDQVPSPAPFWVRLTRTGDTLVGDVSPDGRTWQERGRDTVPLGRDVLIGLCVTSHKNDITTEAKIDSVTVLRIGPQ